MRSLVTFLSILTFTPLMNAKPYVGDPPTLSEGSIRPHSDMKTREELWGALHGGLYDDDDLVPLFSTDQKEKNLGLINIRKGDFSDNAQRLGRLLPNQKGPRLWARSNPGDGKRHSINTQATAWASDDSFSWSMPDGQSRRGSMTQSQRASRPLSPLTGPKDQSLPTSRQQSQTAVKGDSATVSMQQSLSGRLPSQRKIPMPISQKSLGPNAQTSVGRPVPPRAKEGQLSQTHTPSTSFNSHLPPQTPRSRQSTHRQGPSSPKTPKQPKKGVRKFFTCLGGACKGPRPRQ